jgi:hypothetical protein
VLQAVKKNAQQQSISGNPRGKLFMTVAPFVMDDSITKIEIKEMMSKPTGVGSGCFGIRSNVTLSEVEG